jgi:nucleotide-binding universal stress UspA family protein
METILVAVDFTKSSENAARYAFGLASDTKARVTLVHGTHLPLVSDVQFDITASLDSMHAQAQKDMDLFVSKMAKKFPKIKSNAHVEIGFVGEILRKLSKKSEVSLVVLGIGQSDKCSEVVFGSTSTALAGSIGTPVLIIPEKATYKGLSRICLSFDGNKLPTGTGMKLVAELVEKFESNMYYAHVMDENYPIKDESTLKPVFNLLNDTKKNVHFLKSIAGKKVEMIEDFSRRYKINMMVMIAREHNFLWRLIHERNTKKMAFTTSRPLLVLAEKK